MPQRAAAAYVQARTFIDRGRHDVALLLLDEACSLEPGRHLYRAWRAFAAYLAGRCSEQEVLTLTHELMKVADGDQARLLVLLGRVREVGGKEDKADYWYRRAAAMDPHLPEVVEAMDRRGGNVAEPTWRLPPNHPSLRVPEVVEARPEPPRGLWGSLVGLLRR